MIPPDLAPAPKPRPGATPARARADVPTKPAPSAPTKAKAPVRTKEHADDRRTPVRAPARDARDGAEALGSHGDFRTWLTRRTEEGRAAILAHRGNIEGGAKPNTIASLEAARRDRTSDAVEMDISELRDGTLVVYHDGDDPSIESIHDLDRDDLKDHPDIPTLDAWAKRAGELGTNVMAEFKGHGYEREAISTLQRHLHDDQLEAMSFDPDAVRGVHAIDSRIPVTLVIDRDGDAPSVEEQVDDLGFDPDHIEVVRENVNEDVLSAMEARGIGVLVGKEDAGEQLALTKDHRVHGILTDRPTQAANLRDGRWVVDLFGRVGVANELGLVLNPQNT
ncbi:MAG: hypothetical protein JWM86_166 [Thermoleophilia bacterium]|nr:hypothetical protein [Thermoleophilia bacterium]